MPKERNLICIDPGHGGKDPGAINLGLDHSSPIDDLYESEVVLTAGYFLRLHLHTVGRYQAILTRERNVYVGLSERARIANEANADLFVSLHCNAAQNENAKGFEVIYDSGSVKGRVFAGIVCETMINEFPYIRNRGIKPDSDTPHRHLTVLEKTRMPAILVELGFLSNFEEAYWILDNIGQITETLAEGIDRYARRM